MLIDVQFLPSASGWPGLAAAAGLAEDLGYTRVWLFDHLAASSLNVEAAMLECCTTLGALAAVTSRIGLGTLVANVANRYPAVLALAVATAQHISGGRVVAGLGAGAAPGSRWATEHDAAGIALVADAAERHDAVVRQIEAIRAATDTPVIVGVNSTALAGIAGQRADGINVRLSAERAGELIATARDAAGDRAVEVSAYTVDDGAGIRQRATALGIDRLILVTTPDRFIDAQPAPG